MHGGIPVRRADDLNVANISVLDHHGELLALWEGGSASVLDRATLEWRGFKVWGESLEGLPFTAHPKVEPDGTLWAFGVNLVPVRALVLYHIAADGMPVKTRVVDPGPLGIVHDFVVTARHLVIVISPLVFEPSPGDAVLLDAFAWRPALGTRVLVVDKDDFDARRWYQLPAGFGFHHGNGWEDAGGVIRFDHCVARDPSLMTGTMRGIMRGEPAPAAPEHYTRYTLHPGRANGSRDHGRGRGVPPHRAGGDGTPQSLRVHPRRVAGRIRGRRRIHGMAPAPGGQARPRRRRLPARSTTGRASSRRSTSSCPEPSRAARTTAG